MNRQKIRKCLIFTFFLLFPITIFFFSPYLAIIGAFEGIMVGSLVVFSVQFVSSLFLARAFCGWACPGAGLQECCSIVSDKKARGGRLNWIKYVIWAPWISGIIAGFLSAGGMHKIDVLFHTHRGVSVAQPAAYIIYYAVIALIVIPALTAGKRGFCHYICWMAPFMVIGTKIKDIFKRPSLHLTADSNKCVNCKACNKKCQMSLDVNAMVQRGSMVNSECILCGECVDVCPKKVISYYWGRLD